MFTVVHKKTLLPVLPRVSHPFLRHNKTQGVLLWLFSNWAANQSKKWSSPEPESRNPSRTCFGFSRKFSEPRKILNRSQRFYFIERNLQTKTHLSVIWFSCLTVNIGWPALNLLFALFDYCLGQRRFSQTIHLRQWFNLRL